MHRKPPLGLQLSRPLRFNGRKAIGTAIMATQDHSEAEGKHDTPSLGTRPFAVGGRVWAPACIRVGRNVDLTNQNR